MDVLGAWTYADETRGKRAQGREPQQEPEKNWERVAAPGLASGHDVAMNERLHRLDHTRRPFPALLDLLEFG